MRVEIVAPDVARSLRRSVLRPWDPPGSPLPGDDVPDAVHFAALADDGTLLSTCFVYADPWPFDAPADAVGPGWHLRQMATDPHHRGLGAGSAVLTAVIAFVEDQPGPGLLWCNAREVALGFYRRHSFVEVGDLHPDGNPPIPHKYMYRPPTPNP